MSHSFDEEDLDLNSSEENRQNLTPGQLCGCFACCQIFPYEAIREWVREDFKTNLALCPYCRVNAVIGEQEQQEPLTTEFLETIEEQEFNLRSEEKWQNACDPMLLLDYLRYRLSDRKMRLFACASIRTYWHQLTDPRSKQAIEMVEAFADGNATEDVFQSARLLAIQATNELRRKDPNPNALQREPTTSANALGGIFLDQPFYSAINSVQDHPHLNQRDLLEPTLKHLSRLLRDLFGSPFHQPKLDPDWLTWNSRTIPSLAERIYSERAFDLMPILADALQEAGCKDERMLSHCREEKIHAKGCWLLDLLLGKE
jgi:hypothetical protein